MVYLSHPLVTDVDTHRRKLSIRIKFDCSLGMKYKTKAGTNYLRLQSPFMTIYKFTTNERVPSFYDINHFIMKRTMQNMTSKTDNMLIPSKSPAIPPISAKKRVTSYEGTSVT